MAKRLVYLQLTAEFGGTKFGPFQGAEIRLGSDPGRNDIVLPETLGVSPEHVRLVRQQDDSFILAPTERTAAVFVWRGDGRAPKVLQAPIALGAGDGFSVVTAEGPRFVILLELPPVEQRQKQANDPLSKAKSRLGRRSLLQEIRRQGFARALTNKSIQGVYRFATFVKSGAIFQPRYVITGFFLLTGWLMFGASSCAVAGLKWQGDQTSAELDQVKGDLAACQGGTGDGSDGYSLTSLASTILADPDWGQTLAEDAELKAAYVAKLKVLFANSDKYAWVWKRKESPFTQFRRRLDAAGLPPGLVRTLAYAAADAGYAKDREWEIVPDSEGGEACGRGPLLLTYRQARNLAFDNRQLDALLDARTAAQGNVAQMKEALLTTAGEDITLEEGTINKQGATLQGGDVCIFVEGEDVRTDVNRLASQLAKSVGPSAKGLPGEGDNYWIAMRLVRLYAADFKRDYETVQLDAGVVPSIALGSVSAQRKQYVIDRVAEVMARATALPCVAALDKTVQAPAEEIAKDKPSLVPCALMRILVENDQL